MNDHKIALVPEPSRSRLNERKRLDYEDHRRQLIDWLLTFGKKPDHGEGYAYETIRNDSYRLDQFYRWVWEEFDGYTSEITQSHADAYIRHLASREESNYSRSNTQTAIKRLFKWKHYERGGNLWDPEITFSEPSSTSQPRDFLTLDERRKVREAALKYGAIPSYNDLSPEDRDRWKAYLAQRLGKPKRKVKPDDWNKANSWKFPSLVWTSLDAGLRPIEVERAKTTWVDVDNALLRIPREESSKNEGSWAVSLTTRTASALERWLHERDQYDRYEGRNELWLTRYGNPYNRSSLRRLLIKLFGIAGIPSKNRQVSWYSIRHSTGTYITREADLAAAQAQLRHKSIKTTIRYDQAPVEDRREALDRMG